MLVVLVKKPDYNQVNFRRERDLDLGLLLSKYKSYKLSKLGSLKYSGNLIKCRFNQYKQNTETLK